MYFRFYRIVLFCCVFILSPVVFAQDQNEGEAAKPAVKTKPKKESPMKGQTKDLEGDWFMTDEDHPVKLSATYYFGNADKETVPVLLLHDLNGSRRDFAPLIDRLVKAGYAVLAADFRGHGKSTKRYEITPPKIELKTTTVSKNRNNSGGRGQKPKTITQPVVTAPASRKLIDYLVEDFQPDDFRAMIRADLPLLRENLENVHIEGMINLNRLVVVGIGRGAAAAAFWTMQDWRDRKSDRFTKTLVLIAPASIDATTDFSKLFEPNKWIRDDVAIMFAVPNNDLASQGLANKLRTALLDKDAGEDKSKFPIFTYPIEKTVKTDKGETKAPMTMAETFSSGEAKLGQTVFEFIDKRNKAFEEKEARWTKLK